MIYLEAIITLSAIGVGLSSQAAIAVFAVAMAVNSSNTAAMCPAMISSMWIGSFSRGRTKSA